MLNQIRLHPNNFTQKSKKTHKLLFASLVIILITSCVGANKEIIYLQDVIEDNPNPINQIENGTLIEGEDSFKYSNSDFSFSFPKYISFSDGGRKYSHGIKLFMYMRSLDISTMIDTYGVTQNDKFIEKKKIEEGNILFGEIIKINNITGHLYILTRVKDDGGKFHYKLIFKFYIGNIEYAIVFDGDYLLREIVSTMPEYITIRYGDSGYPSYFQDEKQFSEFLDVIYENKAVGIAQEIYNEFKEIIATVEIVD